MLSPLRNRFGIPGVISVIALVFAMFGGAYAASNDDGGGKATASAKGKPGPRGPRGKTGPAGPAGPAGAKGDTGAAGANGSNGSAGKNGVDGVSASATSFGGAQHGCTEGGIEVKSASPTAFVCNGSPWTAGGILPGGATETGAWGGTTAAASDQFPISFNIPLAAGLNSEHVVVTAAEYNGEDEAGAEHEKCPGSVVNPRAKSGFLCIYVQGLNQGSVEGVKNPGGALISDGAGKMGALVFASGEGGEAEKRIVGTWAVTG
jgi:Collagen triple helix repeat (20 copies)